MKQAFPKQTIEWMCGLFGNTRGAYYNSMYREQEKEMDESYVLELIQEQRKEQSRIGTIKLYDLIKPALKEKGIKMGRDALFDLMRKHHLLLRKKKRKTRTTQSGHGFKKYKNHLSGLQITEPYQLLVSDISYIWTKRGFVYWVFVADVYSRKILSHRVAESLAAEHAIQCLKEALEGIQQFPEMKYHHSDAGIQYCSRGYIKVLKVYSYQISMNEKSDPRENAVAERIIGIIKEEYLKDRELEGLTEAQEAMNKAVSTYNSKRPHLSCDMLKPNEAIKRKGKLIQKWKSKKSWMEFVEQ